MKTLSVIALVCISFALKAESPSYHSEEIAYLLNQEMDGLLEAAAKPKVWASGSLPPKNQRSGPAPSQMQGVENLEERFFSDEVSFQAARSLETSEESSEELIEESREPKRKLKARNDGTVSED